MTRFPMLRLCAGNGTGNGAGKMLRVACKMHGRGMADARQRHGRCTADAWQMHGRGMAEAWQMVADACGEEEVRAVTPSGPSWR